MATWFLVGDLSATQFDDLDYLWRAPALPPAVELVLGVLAALIAVASATVLAVALRRGRVRRQWSATVVPLCVAGELVGYAGRVVSAGGIGANIGGALMVFLADPRWSSFADQADGPERSCISQAWSRTCHATRRAV